VAGIAAEVASTVAAEVASTVAAEVASIVAAEVASAIATGVAADPQAVIARLAIIKTLKNKNFLFIFSPLVMNFRVILERRFGSRC
jgi:hypothetical protein